MVVIVGEELVFKVLVHFIDTCIDSIFNTSIRFKNENIVLRLICLFY